jgi:glycosyltransferase involved in cell wall biosynthesis
MKVILLSHIPLPCNKIGSWPKMYDYFFNNSYNKTIDYIICPELINKNLKYSRVDYIAIKYQKYERFIKIIIGYKYYFYLIEVCKLIEQEEKVIVNIIDNVTLLDELHRYLVKTSKRSRVIIVFYIHGFSYYFNPMTGVNFYEKIDDIVFLTRSSYSFEISRYSYITSRVHFLQNGVDSSNFCKPSQEEKHALKESIGLSDKLIFLWVSQNRPKKGLHILLNSWRKSSLSKSGQCILLIIGYEQNHQTTENIRWLGRIPNNELPIYYKSSDYYLFTSLVHEGAPLSLIEAIKSGSTAISSNISPLEEVTQNGKFACLVDYPHATDSWVEKLEAAKDGRLPKINLKREELDKYYDLSEWCENMNNLLFDIKLCVSFSSSPTV